MRTLLAAMTGNYVPLGDPTQADFIVAQSFGAREDEPGRVNELLAKFLVEHTDPEVPLIAQQEIAVALPQERTLAMVIEGEPSGLLGGGLNSWEVFKRAKTFMGIERPNVLIVAQASHVGRLALQAIKQGMQPIVPDDLPREFDPDSKQLWTRNRWLWAFRESVGMAALKLARKL